jgi:hypothetical protein
MRGRKSVLLAEIDAQNSARIRLLDKLLGNRRIWDIHGRRISLPFMYFSSEQEREILSNIGCE